MATSGSKSIAVTSHDTLKFSWSLSSQSVADNTSKVTWKMQLISDGYGKISSTASKSWSVTVNGTKYSGSNTVGIANNTTKTLASGTTTIAHGSDGTKTFSYSFSQEFAITFSGSYIGTKSSSSTGTLTTIPRKSTLSVANGTLGITQTLTVTRKSTSFTHTITYKCGSASGTICTKSTSTSILFAPPMSLSSQNTTGTTVSITYTITTYSGSTSVGSNTYTVTCSIPASVAPTVSMTISDPTGYFSTYGGYVQNLSKITVTVSASGSYSSSIKSYRTTANGGTYTASSFTTGVITASGTHTISTTVTDSRNRTASTSRTATVLAYAVPRISAFLVTRCNQDGTANSGGSYMKVTFSSSVTSLNSKNKATYTLSYKKSTDSAYTTATLSNYANNYAVSGGSYIFAADSASSYNVTLTLADNFRSISSSGTGSTASKTVSLYNEGKGIAFGKIAEKPNLLDSAWRMSVANHSGGVMWVAGMNGDNASIQISTPQSSNGYHPYMYVKSYNGNVWNIGGLGNNVGIYGYYNGRTENATDWYTVWNTSTGDLTHQKNLIVGGYITTNGKSNYNDGKQGVYICNYGKLWLQPNSGGNPQILFQKNGDTSGYQSVIYHNTSNDYMCFDGGTAYAFYNGHLLAYKNDNWLGKWRMCGEWIGCYSSEVNSGSTRKGWMGWDGSNNLYFYNVMNGSMNFSTVTDIKFFCYQGQTYAGQEMFMFREQESPNRTIFRPRTNNTCVLGTTSARWSTAFFYSAITASDLKEKAVIEDFNFKTKEFIMGLQPIAYTRTNEHSGGKRIHLGLGAQTLAKHIKDIDIGDLAMVQASIVNEDGSETPYWGEEIDDEKLSWGINYEELHAQTILMCQEQQLEIDSLKAEMQQLKELVAKLVS